MDPNNKRISIDTSLPQELPYSFRQSTKNVKREIVTQNIVPDAIY